VSPIVVPPNLAVKFIKMKSFVAGFLLFGGSFKSCAR